jgi:transglutaminase-like putative cysteine protease
VHRVGDTNLIVLLLLLLVAVSTALGVADRVRGVDPILALTLAALGLFGGWVVGLTPLPAGWASLLTAVLGLAVVLLRVGRLGSELLALSRAWHRLLLGTLDWATSGDVPTGHAVGVALARLGAGVGALLGRVVDWGTALAAGAPAFDPAAVSFVWGLGLWLVSGWAGWLLCRRDRPLAAITPSGVLLLTAFYHVWGSHMFLIALLLAGFLLMALVSYDGRMRRWRATNVDYPELRPQTITVTVFFSLALVTVAEVVPTIPVRRLLDPAPLMERERSEEAEAVVESLGMEERGRTAFQEVGATGLPRRHLLGAGPELHERVIMVVSTEDRPSGAVPEAGGMEPPGYYWRSHTYDRYTGLGWAADETETVAYRAGVAAITKTVETQRVVRQEVRWLGEEGHLAHAAGTLMVADHDYTVAWRSSTDPFAAQVRAGTYRADSLVPVASERGLREDPGSTPAWVGERYLTLPDGVPARVLALARDLTATAATRYDRARAIEAYLRQFPYSLDVSTPPPGRDVVDFFLFDLQKGYCDYYASAMVVLARAAGVPARLAVGYATGIYDVSEGRYVVSEADAHAWPEIYFPSYGWVRFEPTASLERPGRATEAEAGWVEPEGALEPARGRWGGVRWTWWRWVLVGLALLGLVGVAWLALDRWRLRRREPTAALGSLYRRLRRFGRRLGVPMGDGDTPLEFGAALAGWVTAGVGGRSGYRPPHRGSRCGWSPDQRLRALVVAGAGEIVWLAELYGRARYSPRSADEADRGEALRVWGRLRWRLRLAQALRGLGLVGVDGTT